MMWVASCRWCAVAAALPLWVCLAASASAQQAGARPDDLAVTRLQGMGSEAAFTPLVPQGPQGDLSMLPVTQLADRAAADLDGPRRVALSLARPMPLRDMLMLLVNGTPFSLVVDDSVEGAFTGDLKDLTMRQALEAVLFPRGLDYEVEGSLIRVSAHKPETRLFSVDFLDQRRTWQRTAGGGGVRGGDSPDASVTTTGGSDRLEDVASGVRALLSESGRVHVDRGAGLVQVTDFSERLERIGVYLEAVQARALRQVRIEARVFEVTLSDGAAMGIDWRAAGVHSTLAGGASGAPGTTVPDAGALLTALGEQGAVAMLASPQIVAMNNEPALMRVGTRDVLFETVAAPGRARTTASGTVLEGLTLLVTPQLAGDGSVQLSVAPSYAEQTGEGKASGATRPRLRVSEADTVLRLRTGETAVMSGFLRERTRTTPGVGLASYFGAASHQTVKAELVILLTATVLPAGNGAARR